MALIARAIGGHHRLLAEEAQDIVAVHPDVADDPVETIAPKRRLEQTIGVGQAIGLPANKADIARECIGQVGGTNHAFLRSYVLISYVTSGGLSIGKVRHKARP